MIFFNQLPSFISNRSLNETVAVPLKVGDIIHGKVIEFLSDQFAILQIGKMKLPANVNPSLEPNKRYWFQVVRNDTILELKQMNLSSAALANTPFHPEDSAMLLQTFGIANTKENKQLLHMLLSNHLPFTKDTLQFSSKWLQKVNKNDLSKAQEVIKVAIQKNLPMKENIWTSLLSLQAEEPISSQLVQLARGLQSMKTKSDTMVQLQELVTTLIGQKDFKPTGEMNEKGDFIKEQNPLFSPRISEGLPTGEFMKQKLMEIMKTFGFQYEYDMSRIENEKDFQQLVQLKPLLLKALEEPLSLEFKEKINQLVQHITAQQLLNNEQSTPFQPIFLQIPFLFGDHLTDIMMQWNGKKQANGQIDPNFCRIVFYLQLEYLQEMLVDVQVQHRIISITIYNDTLALKGLVHQYKDILKTQLEKLNYQLSGIHLKKRTKQMTTKDQNITLTTMSVYSSKTNGVDVKI